MTKELAKNILAEHIKLMEQENEPSLKEDIDALTLAIQALSQEPTFDDECQKDMDEAWEQIQKKRKRIPVTLDLTPCDAISREMVNTLVDELARAISDERCHIPQRGRDTGHIMHDILELPSVTQKSGKWDRLYSWLNDMRLGIAPDETVDDIDERHCRESQTDILDEIMEWMIKAESEDKE